MYTKHNQMTVGEIPAYYGNKFDTRDKLAVASNDGFRITWRELNRRSNQLARVMVEDFHLKRGDKVLTFMTNCGQYPEIIYGLAKKGICIVPVSFRFVPRELKYVIDHSDANAIILTENLYETFAQVKDEVNIPSENVLVIGSGESGNYEKRLREKSGDDVEIEADENDLFWMGFTGGTTGHPKASLVTHRTVIQTWFRITIEFTILGNDYELISGAFYHGLGFLFGLQQLSVGGKIFIAQTFDPELVLRTIEQEKITVTPMVPTMYNQVLNFPGKETFNVQSMRVLICAGEPLLTKVKEAIIRFFPNAGLYEYYGSTEHGFYTILKPEDQLRKVRSCGLPFFGMQIKILDENGNELPPGQIGEIYKRGLLLGAEYYKNREATEACYRGEWASSGDMGYLDEEGYLYIVDRKKDMIISGGVNMFPSEIEEIILSHPGVKEVAVIGLPDETWGERVTAYIVPREGAALDENAIMRYCAERLSKIKVPKAIHFINELPKSAAGKTLKRELRRMVMEKQIPGT